MNILINYTLLYHAYQLLYYKDNVKQSQYKIFKKPTLDRTYLQNILHHITLTLYYIIKPCLEDKQSQNHKSEDKKTIIILQMTQLH